MASYKVVFSPIFKNELIALADGAALWGTQAVEQYATEIWHKVLSLNEMPYRFPVYKWEGDVNLRSFNHKAHKVFYEIREAEKLVLIVRLLRQNRDLETALTSSS